MAPVTPSTEPTDVVAGDTWTWTHANGDYPISEGWVLSYSIRGASAPVWDTSWVTDDGSIWTVVIPAASTASVTAGSYTFERHYTGSGTYAGRRYSVQLPRLDVEANAETAAAGALQTFEEKMLAALKSLLYPSSGTVSDVESYQIHGRAITKMKRLELQRWYDDYAQRVARQQNAGRGITHRIAFGHAR
jgi:hypothetical protein